MVLTHPMAGNYRIDPSELESDRVHARALIVTRLVTPPAGAGLSLEDLLRRRRHSGAGGHRHPCADTGAAARRRATGRDPPRSRSRREADAEGRHAVAGGGRQPDLGVGRPRGGRLDPIDAQRGCHGPATAVGRCWSTTASSARCCERSRRAAWRSRVLPHDASAAEVAAHRPDLVVLSPGPGDPARMAPQIATVATLAARRHGRWTTDPGRLPGSSAAGARRRRSDPSSGRSATTAATTP